MYVNIINKHMRVISSNAYWVVLVLVRTNNPEDSNIYDRLIKPKTLHKIKIGIRVDLKTDVILIYCPQLKRNCCIDLLIQPYKN